MKEWHKLLLIIILFLAAYFMPVEHNRFQSATLEAFRMLQEYARLHVLTCLVPAFFIAGAIVAFIRQGEVMKYLGPKAPKPLAYGVASGSGSILAVCSCTVLPLFAGIWRQGAGIGPASSFLYSGPAINILAMVLTARVLGMELGLSRIIGAVGFAVLIGLLMAAFFEREKDEQERTGFAAMPDEVSHRKGWQTLVHFLALIGILIFATWGKPGAPEGLYAMIHKVHWFLAGFFLLLVLYTTFKWLNKDDRLHWIGETWTFVKQIAPLLLGGVLVAGFLLGRPGADAGIIPMAWVERLVGGNGVGANLFASVFGAFMYFATLTEVPILQGLLGAGMGKGPGLALLLAGPALSLPSMIVITSVMGMRKAFTYFGLVIILSATAGVLFGTIAA